jgi:hypothetical protein
MANRGSDVKTWVEAPYTTTCDVTHSPQNICANDPGFLKNPETQVVLFVGVFAGCAREHTYAKASGRAFRAPEKFGIHYKER